MFGMSQEIKENKIDQLYVKYTRKELPRLRIELARKANDVKKYISQAIDQYCEGGLAEDNLVGIIKARLEDDLVSMKPLRKDIETIKEHYPELVEEQTQ